MIKPLQDDFTAWDYLVMCIYGLIVVISLFGNGLVFSVIIRTRYPTSTISRKKNICLGSHSNIITLFTKANVRFQSWDLFAMEKLVVNRVHPQKHNIYQLCWSTSTFRFSSAVNEWIQGLVHLLGFHNAQNTLLSSLELSIYH